MKKVIYYLSLISIILVFGNAKYACASPSLLVIDEFRTRTVAATGDEYIVLANYGTSPIGLLNYSLAKKTASGNNYTLISKFPDVTIQPGQKLILGYKNYSGAKDLVYTTASLADSNNSIILFNNSGKIVDSVTYGEVNFIEQEGEPLNDPEAGIPYKRLKGQDTDNNYLDFVADIPPKFLDVNADKLIITELMPNPETDDEWIEVFNPTNQLIRLDNLKLCDLLGRVHCYKFSEGSAIHPHQYLTVDKAISKITLNNDGDVVEIRDYEDSVLSSTGEDYGDAEDGITYALFGSTWTWTGAVTRGGQNIFVDMVENEPRTKKAKKTSTKKKIVKTVSTESDNENVATDGDTEGDPEVKGEGINATGGSNIKITRKVVGIFLIALAFIVLLGYTVWDKKDRLYEIIKRFSRKNN
jgi:hypothetical protein